MPRPTTGSATAYIELASRGRCERDGYSDVIIGEPSCSDLVTPLYWIGAANLYLGGSSIGTVADATMIGTTQQEYLGWSVY